jgi:hypothetical protein
MTNTAKLGRGDVSLTLDGETITLRPTIAAFQFLSKQHGGLVPVLNKLAALDFDVIMDVIMAGLMGQPNVGPKRRIQLGDKVFSAGVSDHTGGVNGKCAEFVVVLMNGGRPPSDNPDDMTDEAPAEGN